MSTLSLDEVILRALAKAFDKESTYTKAYECLERFKETYNQVRVIIENDYIQVEGWSFPNKANIQVFELGVNDL